MKALLFIFLSFSLISCGSVSNETPFEDPKNNGGDNQNPEDCAVSNNNPIPNCHKWKKLPIKITIPTKEEGNSWSNEEITALKESISVYNEFYNFFIIDENQNYSNQSEFGHCTTSLDCLKNKTLNFLSKMNPFNIMNNNNALAVNIRYHDDVNIIYSQILLNSSHSFEITDNPSGTSFDLKSVIIHELGHFLGLEHPCEKMGCASEVLSEYPSLKEEEAGEPYSTVMLYSISKKAQRRELTQWDKDKLNKIYNLGKAPLDYCDKDVDGVSCLNF